MPYNTIWPGCQRPIGQTELTSVVSFAGDEEVTVTVRPKHIKIDETTDIVIRPLSKKVNYKLESDQISFCLKENGFYTIQREYIT